MSLAEALVGVLSVSTLGVTPWHGPIDKQGLGIIETAIGLWYWQLTGNKETVQMVPMAAEDVTRKIKALVSSVLTPVP